MTISKQTGTSWTNSSGSNKIIEALGTGFGAGYSSRFSGTFGSLFGVGAFFLTRNLSPIAQAIIFLFFCFLAIGIAEKIERTEKTKDPDHIIIDETIGMWVSLLFIWQINTSSVFTAFVLFRFFKILKPFPLNLFQGFNGGVGIVADDLAAGMMTNFILRLILLQGIFG